MPKTSTSGAFNPTAFRARLARWYGEHGRHDLPWRQTRDPYAVLVSEVMLQQTQVERVLPYYRAWLTRWPSFESLAAASPAEVIRAWKGLGYNRRSVNLLLLAVAVSERYAGALPVDPAELRTLPGIGPYTAAAVRCFAREEAVPVADTNIARVLARARLGVASQREVTPGALQAAAVSLLPRAGARDHNLALMDLGALVCTSRAPRCESCPVSAGCAWRRAGYLPTSIQPTPAPPFETTARFARGRIMDFLREAPATRAELARGLPAAHRPKTSAYLAALASEGLVVESHPGVWSLPGSAGSSER